MKVGDALTAFRRQRGQTEPRNRAQIFWVKIGPVSVPIPNPGQLHWHDLHHVVLGYDTDLVGEMEISAFELRTVPRTTIVFLLCVAGVMAGLVWAPRRTLAAWRRGAGCRNLYGCGLDYDAVLGQPTEELRAWMLAPGSDRLHAGRPLTPRAPRSGAGSAPASTSSPRRERH